MGEVMKRSNAIYIPSCLNVLQCSDCLRLRFRQLTDIGALQYFCIVLYCIV